MHVLALPLVLPAGGDVRQPVYDPRRLLAATQQVNHANVPAGLLLRNTHQLLDIRADVIDVQRGGVQHDKDVVHVGGQRGKELLAVEDLRVLVGEAAPVAPQQQHAQRSRNAADQQQGAVLQRVHAGVHNARRDDAQHDPVLEVRGLVGQIVVHAIKSHEPCAGAPLSEVLLKRGNLLVAQGGIGFKHCDEVVEAEVLRARVLHDDAPVHADDEAAGTPAERGNLQRIHQIRVVEADGDGLIVKSLIRAGRHRNGKDHDLRFAGHDGVDHHVLPAQHQRGQLLFEVQIARFAPEGSVIALAGDEEEVGKPHLILPPRNEIESLPVVLHILEVRRPHVHHAPVPADQIVQRLVRQMIDFR